MSGQLKPATHVKQTLLSLNHAGFTWETKWRHGTTAIGSRCRNADHRDKGQYSHKANNMFFHGKLLLGDFLALTKRG
jgi:hypothetical protein